MTAKCLCVGGIHRTLIHIDDNLLNVGRNAFHLSFDPLGICAYHWAEVDLSFASEGFHVCPNSAFSCFFVGFAESAKIDFGFFGGCLFHPYLILIGNDVAIQPFKLLNIFVIGGCKTGAVGSNQDFKVFVKASAVGCIFVYVFNKILDKTWKLKIFLSLQL